MSRGRFTIEHPPIPRDCIRDACVDPEQGSGGAVVKIGHARDWIDGAEYEADRTSMFIERTLERLDAELVRVAGSTDTVSYHRLSAAIGALTDLAADLERFA